eukprot:50142-Eustigmatos_ZCMA.PRE.1
MNKDDAIKDGDGGVKADGKADNDTKKKKKAQRNKSLVEQQMLLDKEKEEEDGSDAVRYLVVRCCLRAALKGFQEAQKFKRIMDEEARTQGLYRRVVGLFSNWRMMKKLTEQTEVPKIDKTFFDTTWSALDYVRDKKGRRKSKE